MSGAVEQIPSYRTKFVGDNCLESHEFSCVPRWWFVRVVGLLDPYTCYTYSNRIEVSVVFDQ